MYRVLGKRLIDTLLAVALAPLGCILCAVCILAIRLEGGGPAIFSQVRVGKDLKPFTLYKLRTMSKGTGDKASHEVSQSQITRTGAILRKAKLDELPQILNVLKGEMSFVGPRPCLPSQSLLIAEREKRGVFRVLPGITGPAQIAGIDMSTPIALAEADAEYCRTIGFFNDLRCMFLTALGSGSGDAVKRS